MTHTNSTTVWYIGVDGEFISKTRRENRTFMFVYLHELTISYISASTSLL